MGYTTIDDYIEALCASTAQYVRATKVSQTAEGAGLFHSLWMAAGNYPSAGATPPAFTADTTLLRPTNVVLGSIPFTNPAGGTEARLASLEACGVTVGRVILYDRVWHCSGFAGNTASTQTITNAVNWPVNRGTANGVGVEPFLEFYGAIGVTGSTITLSFKDPADATVSATYTHPTNPESVGQMVPMLLPSGCTGVKYPISITLAPSSGTLGDFGITLMRRIASVPIQLANVGDNFDLGKLGFPKVESSACLALMVLCSTTSTGFMMVNTAICET